MFPPTQSFCNSQNRQSDVNIVLKCQPPSSLWMVAFSLIQFPLSFVPTNRCQWCPSRWTCQNHLVEWDFLEAAFCADCYCSIWMSFKIWLAFGRDFWLFPRNFDANSFCDCSNTSAAIQEICEYNTWQPFERSCWDYECAPVPCNWKLVATLVRKMWKYHTRVNWEILECTQKF